MKKQFCIKKGWSLLLTMVAVLFLASCGGSDEDPVMGSNPDPTYGENEAIKADGAELSWLVTNSPVILVNSVYLDYATSNEKKEFKKSFSELCTIAEHFRVPGNSTRGPIGIAADVISFCEHLGRPAASANQKLYEMLRQAYGKSGEDQLNEKLWNMSKEYVEPGYDFVDFTYDIASGNFNHPGLLGKIYVDETFLMKLEDYSVNSIRHKYLAETTGAVAKDAMSIVMDAAPGDLIGASATTIKILEAVKKRDAQEVIKTVISTVNSDIDDLYNIESIKNSVASMIQISGEKHFDYAITKSLFSTFLYQEVGTDYVWEFFNDTEHKNTSTRYKNYTSENYSYSYFNTVLVGEHFFIKQGDRYVPYDIVQTVGADYKEISIKMWKAGTYNPMEFMTLVRWELPAKIVGSWQATYTENDDYYGYYHEEVNLDFEGSGKFTITVNISWSDKFETNSETNIMAGTYKVDGDRVSYTITKVIEDGKDNTSKVPDNEKTGSFVVDIDGNNMKISGKGELAEALSEYSYTRK